MTRTYGHFFFQFNYLTGTVFLIFMLERDVHPLGRVIFTEKLALNPGSSKQGNAFLASVGWNCVVARYLRKAHTFNHRSSNCLLRTRAEEQLSWSFWYFTRQENIFPGSKFRYSKLYLEKAKQEKRHSCSPVCQHFFPESYSSAARKTLGILD